MISFKCFTAKIFSIQIGDQSGENLGICGSYSDNAAVIFAFPGFYEVLLVILCHLNQLRTWIYLNFHPLFFLFVITVMRYGDGKYYFL